MSNDKYTRSGLPEFISHKIVKAGKIWGIFNNSEKKTATLALEGQESVEVDHEYLEKHQPVPRAYYVLYRDGYESCCPEEAFEEGYSQMSEAQTDGAEAGPTADSPPYVEDLDNLFTYHPPGSESQVERYNRLREAGKQLAQVIIECVPVNPDRSAAIRKVREAVMTANAGIACGE